MNCDNCDNKIDGVCCHQAIRQRTEVTDNDADIKREFDRIERKQSQHKPLFGVLVPQPRGGNE